MDEEKETFFDKYGKYIMGFIAAWFAYAYYLSMNEPSKPLIIPQQVNEAEYKYGYDEGEELAKSGSDSSGCLDLSGDAYTGCVAGVASYENYLNEDW